MLEKRLKQQKGKPEYPDLRHGVGLLTALSRFHSGFEHAQELLKEPADRNAYGKSPPALGFQRFGRAGVQGQTS